jgi:hypothetical protein
VVDVEKHDADRDAGFKESGAVRITAILRVDHLAARLARRALAVTSISSIG